MHTFRLEIDITLLCDAAISKSRTGILKLRDFETTGTLHIVTTNSQSQRARSTYCFHKFRRGSDPEIPNGLYF